jgi:hypothetical protein
MKAIFQNRRNILLVSFLLFYIALGISTELKFIQGTPLPETLFVDFAIYERALVYALHGNSPYTILEIGPGFLYPPSALFLVELFYYITPFSLKVSAYSAVNIVLLVWMVYGVANYYGYKGRQIWYWYIICLGFSPFLELLHVGQINIITLFGLFLLFVYTRNSAGIGGAGLALAILTKVSPLLFFMYLFALRKWKVIAAAVTIIIVLSGLSALRYGLDGVLEYPTVLMYITHQFPLFTNVQSLVAKVAWLREFLNHKYGLSPALLVYLAENVKFTQQLLNFYIATLVSTSAALLYFGRQQSEYLFIITTMGMMLLPNVMWYHHYVFILLPLIIWMGWAKLDQWVTAWCFMGLIIIQIDRFYITYGLLIHMFSHITMLIILYQQIKIFIDEFRSGIRSRQNQSIL